MITTLSPSSTVEVALEFNITLTCTSSGSPPDTFTWMKDGVPVTQSTDITAVDYTSTSAVFSSSYTISNVSISDNGTYTCTVTNPIGSDNYTFTVNVHSKCLTCTCVFECPCSVILYSTAILLKQSVQSQPALLLLY